VPQQNGLRGPRGALGPSLRDGTSAVRATSPELAEDDTLQGLGYSCGGGLVCRPVCCVRSASDEVESASCSSLRWLCRWACPCRHKLG
jgi:hypothetical protein